MQNQHENTNTPILPSQNLAWGFWNAMQDKASVAWPLAMTAIAKACDAQPEQVRTFLDSRYGRHFGDEVNNYRANGTPLNKAIESVIQQWMSKTMGYHRSWNPNLPRDLPALKGFVLYGLWD